MIADTPAASESFRQRFATWLLRPYLDLGPLVVGPLYARGIEEYWRAFEDPQAPPFALQRTLLPAFRSQLIGEAGRPEYAVGDPRQLPEPLWTERWRILCDALDHWGDLAGGRRRRLMMLLHSLCIYEPVLALVPASSPRAVANDADAIELTYWRASAHYVAGIPNRVSDYAAADMSVFEAIVADAPHAVPAAFNAAVKVFVHKSKVGASLAELTRWRRRVERVHADTVNRVDDFTAGLLTSRFYRAMGFLPQHRGDRAEVVRLMDLAERHARAMKPATSAQELLYLENLHPVMESRTKEALWLGDRDLALARTLEVVELDPYDSKAWVELGQVRMLRKEWAHAAQAYLVSATLGPPASAIGRHMAGVCFRECGQDLLAAFFFKDALEIDPLGISPRDEIHRLPDTAVLGALKEWSRSTVRL
jgi:tetratricopeptide (TPR) repeat protein